MAAVFVALVVAIGSSLYIAEIRRYEDYNRAAVALGSLRCAARLVDRFVEQHGQLPSGDFAAMLAQVATVSRPRHDPLFDSLIGSEKPFTHYFTHAQAPGGANWEAEVGRFRHQEVSIVDPFGKPYQYLLEVESAYTAGLVLGRDRGFVLNTGGRPRCRYVLVSMGLDHRFGTADDIRVTSATPPDIKEMVPTLRRPWSE